YQHAGPLDLRMDARRGATLADRLAGTTETELAEVLRAYGDVKPARALARALLTAHREGLLADTRALAALARRVLRDPRPAAAAPVFQALRMWVNDEMADLESGLEWLPQAMADGGVVVTLSYHSGEDRRVKQALRGAPRPGSRRLPEPEPGASGPWEELTKKVV